MDDKRSKNGSLIEWDAESLSSKVAVQIADMLMNLPAFKVVKSLLKSKKAELYFEKYFKIKIHPYISRLLIIKWHERNNIPFPISSIVVPSYPWFPLLESAWPDPSIPVRTEKSGLSDFNAGIVDLTKSRLRSLIELSPLAPQYLRPFRFSSIAYLVKTLLRFGQKVQVETKKQGSQPLMAVRYVEGIDLDQSSDIFWELGSGISLAQILIYFEGPDNKTQRPVSDAVIEKIEDMGMQWVSLRYGSVNRSREKVWLFRGSKSSTLTKSFESKLRSFSFRTSLEKWLVQESVNLLRKVEYWRAFFSDYNVKLHCDPQESGLDNIIKSIAIDICGGLSLGKERSYFSFPAGTMLGDFPQDVIFAWNRESSRRLSNYLNKGDYAVISGFIYESSYKRLKNKALSIRKKLLKNSAKLIIAIFDNVHSMNEGLRQVHIYTPHLIKFYKRFLEWVLEDDEVGLVIKSKKPVILKTLPEIHSLLEKAEETGRCYRITDGFGAPPALAALASDLAVTIGLVFPRTFVESVLAGCRSIHYDVTNIRPFEKELYEWGYGKVIFDDLDKLVAACKRYKENPKLEPGLGDFSEHLDDLDPFRDGKAAKRVSEYLGWLLEGFENGGSKEEVLEEANKQYAAKWGEDKIVRIQD
jgi:hypothetical protein